MSEYDHPALAAMSDEALAEQGLAIQVEIERRLKESSVARFGPWIVAKRNEGISLGQLARLFSRTTERIRQTYNLQRRRETEAPK